MRRTIPTLLALSLALVATPVLAQDEEAASDAAETQRYEVPALGFAVDFPAEWSVLLPEGERVSALTDADGEAIMETTLIYANAGGGTVCDVDAFLDMPADSPLEGFAYEYVNFLQQTEGADSAMVVGETEVADGAAYRIEIFNQATGHIRAVYVFDGPARDDGTFERYLLACGAREVGEPFWQAIAESVEFSEAAPAEDDEMAEDDMAEDEGSEDDEAGSTEEG